jgi:hypothetical protein
VGFVSFWVMMADIFLFDYRLRGHRTSLQAEHTSTGRREEQHT